MKLKEVDRRPENWLREVSDLRTQFQCEYRLLLKQRVGDSSSDAGVTGTVLHRLVSDQVPSLADSKETKIVPLLIIVVAIVLGVLWILW
ncbi:MAG: hypothetical protein ACFFE6_04505 [Candidatus Thorarchaeota archaeon]